MKSTYILLILLPIEIRNKVEEVRDSIASVFPTITKSSLPPHITLLPAFKTDNKGIETFKSSLISYLTKNKTQTITISTNNFIALPNTNLSIDLEKNEQILKLRNELKLWLISLKITPQKREKYHYAPHITIRNKFRKKADFRELLNQFQSKEFKVNFDLNEIILFGKCDEAWKQLEQFKL